MTRAALHELHETRDKNASDRVRRLAAMLAARDAKRMNAGSMGRWRCPRDTEWHADEDCNNGEVDNDYYSDGDGEEYEYSEADYES